MSAKTLLISLIVMLMPLIGCGGEMTEAENRDIATQEAGAVGGSPDPDEIEKDVKDRLLEHVPVFIAYDARYREIRDELESAVGDDQAICRKLPGWVQEIEAMAEYVAEARPDFKVGLVAALEDVDDLREMLIGWRDALIQGEGLCEAVTSIPQSTAGARPTPSPVPAGPVPTPEPNPESVGLLVVKISASEYHGGSGFIVSVEGNKAFVVTSHHVVADAADTSFKLGGNCMMM